METLTESMKSLNAGGKKTQVTAAGLGELLKILGQRVLCRKGG